MSLTMNAIKILMYLLSWSLGCLASKDIGRDLLKKNQSCTTQRVTCNKTQVTTMTTKFVYKGCYYENKHTSNLMNERHYNLTVEDFSTVTCFSCCKKDDFVGLQYLGDKDLYILKCFCISKATKQAMFPVGAECGSQYSVSHDDYNLFKYVYVYGHLKTGIQTDSRQSTIEAKESTTLADKLNDTSKRIRVCCMVENTFYERGTYFKCDRNENTTMNRSVDIIATTKAKNSLTSKQTKTTKSVPTSDATSTYLSPTSTEYVLTKDGFDLQFTLGLSTICSVVVLLAVMSICMSRLRRVGKYSFHTPKAVENETLTDSNHTKQSSQLTFKESYSYPKDTLFHPNKDDESNLDIYSRPKFSDESEYHHLDFTLRSDNNKTFVSDGEYARPRADTVSVFYPTWNAWTSRINKLFSQFRSSIYDSAGSVRNLILKREVGHGNQLQSENIYADDWRVQNLNKPDTTEKYLKGDMNDIDIEIDTLEPNKYHDLEQERSTRNKHGGLPLKG